jgi:uncharacterized membrane protein
VDDLWKFLHIVAGMALVAGLVGRGITIAEARRATDLTQLEGLLRAARRFEETLVRPPSLLVLVLGLITMVAQGRSLVGEGNWWLLTSLVLFLLLGALVPLVFLPRGTRFETALETAKAEGAVTPELTAAFADPVVALARRTELFVLAVIVGLMVFKPF